LSQSEIEAITSNWRQAREKARGKSQFVLVSPLIGWENGAFFFSQPQNEGKQSKAKQSKANADYV